MDSERYSIIDLLKNDAFLSWVKRPTPELDAYWNAWRAKDQVKIELIHHAKQIILSIDFKKSSPGEIDDQRILNRIKKTLQQNGEEVNHSYRIDETLEQSIIRKDGVKAPTSLKSFL